MVEPAAVIGVVNGICNTGVSCFILISGYYGIKYDIKKLIKLESMMISYSLMETGILCVVFPEQMQGAVLLEQLVKSMIPFISRKYWFYSCYVCLFLLSGYIEKVIEKLSKKEFEKLLMLSILLFSVLPTLFYFEIVPDSGKGLVQMIMVYMIGRYIRLYWNDEAIPDKRVLVVIGMALWGINGVSHELPIKVGGIYHHLCKDNSITNLTMAIIIFILFKNMSFHSRLINKASSYIFAAFALNNSLVMVFMTLMKEYGLQSTSSANGFFKLAFMVLGILMLCLLLGVVREGLLEKIDKRLGKKIMDIKYKKTGKYNGQ